MLRSRRECIVDAQHTHTLGEKKVEEGYNKSKDAWQVHHMMMQWKSSVHISMSHVMFIMMTWWPVDIVNDYMGTSSTISRTSSITSYLHLHTHSPSQIHHSAPSVSRWRLWACPLSPSSTCSLPLTRFQVSECLDHRILCTAGVRAGTSFFHHFHSCECIGAVYVCLYYGGTLSSSLQILSRLNKYPPKYVGKGYKWCQNT